MDSAVCVLYSWYFKGLLPSHPRTATKLQSGYVRFAATRLTFKLWGQPLPTLLTRLHCLREYASTSRSMVRSNILGTYGSDMHRSRLTLSGRHSGLRLVSLCRSISGHAAGPHNETDDAITRLVAFPCGDILKLSPPASPREGCIFDVEDSVMG